MYYYKLACVCIKIMQKVKVTTTDSLLSPTVRKVSLRPPGGGSE